MKSLPAGQALALVASLLQGQTAGTVCTGIAIGRARIDGHVTLIASVATSAEASYILIAWLILAHGTCRTRVIATVGSLFLAVNTRVSSWTIAAIALRQILALSAIVAWLRGTLIDILFATTTGETSRTEALHIVSHGHTESTVLASTLATDHGLALLASLGSCAIGSHIAGAFVAALCAWRALVVMQRARRAGCQTSGGVGTRSTLGTTQSFR